MAIGLVGKKCGMTRVFNADGESIPVTVIHVEPNRIVQIKTKDKEGYCAIQITAGQKRIERLTKPLAGHYKKANVAPGQGLWEWRIEEGAIKSDAFKVGSELTVELFKNGQWVDVTGITKGKGFAGTVKRHHFRMQDASHGNSLSHRAPGSIGQRQTPGRVFRGKKMSGHLGVDKRTIQNQKIVKVDKDKNLLLIQGAVPGAPSGIVFVYPAVKNNTQKEKAHGA